MNPVPLPWMLIAFGFFIISGFATGYGARAKQDEAEQTRLALTASQSATARATQTTEIIGELSKKPDLDTDAGVAERLRDATCNRAGVPGPAVRTRSPSPSPADIARPDQAIAGELKQCVKLADEYDALRETWKANEASPVK